MKFDSSGNFDEVLHTTVSAKPYIFFMGLRVPCCKYARSNGNFGQFGLKQSANSENPYSGKNPTEANRNSAIIN